MRPQTAHGDRSRHPPAVLLTTDAIARLTGTPVRTVRARLAAWRAAGGPVVRATTGTRGQPPLAVRLEDYARRVARDPAELRAELAGLAEVA